MSPIAPGMLWPQQVRPRGSGQCGPLLCDEIGRLEGYAVSARGGGCHLMPLRYQATGSAVAPPWSDAPPLEMPFPPPFPVFSHYLSFPYYFFFYPSFVNLWCGWGINRSLKSGHKYCLSFISGLFIVGTLKLVAVSRDGCTCGPLITVTGKREHGVGREMAGGRTWWVGYDQYTLYKFRESLSCRDCCTVKSTCYSCWWPKFNSQHPQGGL